MKKKVSLTLIYDIQILKEFSFFIAQFCIHSSSVKGLKVINYGEGGLLMGKLRVQTFYILPRDRVKLLMSPFQEVTTDCNPPPPTSVCLKRMCPTLQLPQNLLCPPPSAWVKLPTTLFVGVKFDLPSPLSFRSPCPLPVIYDLSLTP